MRLGVQSCVAPHSCIQRQFYYIKVHHGPPQSARSSAKVLWRTPLFRRSALPHGRDDTSD
jgi:hypothetical protein